MRKILRIVLIVIVGVVIVVPLVTAYRAQRADYGWQPSLPAPTFADDHPLVAVDQAHHNASTAGWTNRYWPFARLLRADGYRVIKGTSKFTAAALDSLDILVIVNASGAAKLQMFGVNVTGGADGDRSAPAFSATEIKTVRAWVERGGSLLLIADHAPFGAASAGLAEAFGITMYKGFVEVPGEISDPLYFADTNQRLGDHPILRGDSPAHQIHTVMTFTGQSLDGPPEAVPLLLLPATAVEYIAAEPEFLEQPAGRAQGYALTCGRGRVVVLGEAAMLTAQVDNAQPFGMNLPGNDNQQFALNIMHWLSRRL